MLALSGYGGSPEPDEAQVSILGPSESADIAIDINVVRYHQQCLLLRSCGALLRFPPRPITTALAYLHKYYEAGASGEEVPLMDSCVSFGSISCLESSLTGAAGRIRLISILSQSFGIIPFLQQSLVSACLLLASKVEEVPVSNNHLLNSASMLAQVALVGVDLHLLQNPTSLAQPSLTNTAVLVGPEYYRVKENVLALEQVLLRKMHFMLNIDQPHQLLFSMLNDAAAAASAVWGDGSSSNSRHAQHVGSNGRTSNGRDHAMGGATEAVLVFKHRLGETAVCILNDMLVYSDVMVKQGGGLLASAALHTALLLLAEGGPSVSSTCTEPGGAATADADDVTESWVCEALLGAQARLSLAPALQAAAAAQSDRARLLSNPTWCEGFGVDPLRVHALAKCVIEVLLPAATAFAATAEEVHTAAASKLAVAALVADGQATPAQQ